jgi:hypothetical protein
MQTDLLHDIGDVGPCEGQVLENSYNTSKLRSLLNRRPKSAASLAWKSTGVVHDLQSAIVAHLMMSSM